MWPDTFGEWARRLIEERNVHHAAYALARNYRVCPARARDLADDAVQHGLSQAASCVDVPGRFASYAHFRNWVRVCAVNHVHDQFRHHAPALLAEPDALPAPESEMDAEQARLIRASLDELAATDRALHWDGLT